jgi:glyoxylase-like metal-dependent hydrolase (beta-lactamase superfamily II)
MQFGRFEIFQLSDGLFELKSHWMQELAADELPRPAIGRTDKRRLVVGIHPLVVRTEEALLLCDTGIGTKHRNQPCDWPTPVGSHPSVKEQLEALGISPASVTHILLTHMHYDHAGGLTCLDQAGDLVRTYPRARVYVQNDEWEAAQEALYESSSAYRSENWGLYQDSERLVLVDGDEEVVPGVRLVKTGGHTRGHQVVLLDDGNGQKAALFGDLIPTTFHFSPFLLLKFDYNPEEAKKWRTYWVEKALEEGWLVFFYHSPHVKAGYGYRKESGQIKVKKFTAPDLHPAIKQNDAEKSGRK